MHSVRRWLRVLHFVVLLALGTPYLAWAAPLPTGQVPPVATPQAPPPVELSYVVTEELPAFLPYSLDFAVAATAPTPQAAPAVVSVTLPAGAMPEDALTQQLVRLFFYDEAAGQWQKLVTERIQAGDAWMLRAPAAGPGVYAAALATTNDYGDYAQPWQPTVSEAQVDLFTGAVQWSYPIDVPGGRGGIQPGLALSYNSGIVDNLTGKENPQPDGVALGWSLGTNYIARKIQPDTTDGVPEYLEEYTLVLNGVSSKLIALGGNQYALENERYWKIERIEESGVNRGGDYWHVTLPDGVQYRFGYQDETAGADSRESAWWMVTAEAHSDHFRYTNWRWNLDEISDRQGNLTRLDYARETNDFVYLNGSEAHIYSQGHWCNGAETCVCKVYDMDFNCHDYMAADHDPSGYTRGGRLEQITYSWPGAAYKVVFEAAPRDDYVTAWDSQVGTQTFQTFWSKQRLSSIAVYGADQSQLLRRYELAATKKGAVLTLDSIQEAAADGSRLPATIFFYHYLAGYCDWIQGGNCKDGMHEFSHKYWLAEIRNGYGGGMSFNYGTPDSFQNGKTYHPTADAENRYWYRYRVRKVSTWSGLGAGVPGTTTHYQYLENNGAAAAGNWKGDEFRGHPRVRVLRYDHGAVASYTDHSFYQGLPKTTPEGCVAITEDVRGMEGREYLTVQFSAGGEELARSGTTYRYCNLGGGRRFISPGSVWSYPEGISFSQRSHVDYGYDGYGNVSIEVHHGDPVVPGDEYVIERGYLPNTERWIVSAPQTETLKTFAGVALRQTLYAYDGQPEGVAPVAGKVTQVRQGLGDLWTTTQTYYDAWGNPTVVTDALGHTARTVYDERSHQFPVAATNAKGQSTTTQWDLRLGVPTVFTDANGAAAQIAYDNFGRVTTVTPPGDAAPSARYTYPAVPFTAPFAVTVETRIDAYLPIPQYQRSWTIYDGLGRVIQTQSEAEGGLLVLSDTAYDQLGRPVAASTPYTVAASGGAYRAPDWNSLRQTVTAYDLKDRVIAVTAPDGSVTQKAYQPWRELLLDANGHQTIYANDGLGRLTVVSECYGTYATPTWGVTDPAVTRYTHDAAGNLVRVMDALGHVTALSYDALGRKTAMDDPSMGKWRYAYDLAGNLIRQTDAEGQTLVFEYDELNRLIRKSAVRESDTNTRIAEYAYDQGLNGIGRRTTMTDTSGTASWQYDEQGRAIRETRTIVGSGTFVTTQGYDAAGRVITTALPTGEVVRNTYNLRGLPETVTGLDAYLTGATYNALGQPLGQTWGNGRQTVYGYDPATQRLESLRVGALLDLSYTYDRVGNLLSLSDGGNGGQVQTFAYDARDRLTSAQTDAVGQGRYRETYGYNAMGNIITRTYGSQTVVYTYGRKHGLKLPGAPVTHTVRARQVYLPLLARSEFPGFQQPFAVVATSAGFRAGYDRNGNMLVRIEVSGTQVITYVQEWTVENRLAVVTNTATGEATRFVYDGDGNRVLREDPTGLTINVGAVEVEIGGTQRLTTTYYFADGQRIAMRKDGKVTYLHGDHLGSASLATDASGARVSEMRYTPFGETRYGDAPTDRRFTGQREEAGIGLYDFNARFYAASVGRFVSADSIVPDPNRPQNFNRYSYVGDNPLRYFDPSGHGPQPPVIQTDADSYGAGIFYEFKEEDLAEIAKVYGIPWQVLAGVLDAEILLDTNSEDLLETAFFEHAPEFLRSLATSFYENPGPGIGNIHIDTARSTSLYMAEYYANSTEMQLNLQSKSTEEIAALLTDREFNIQVAAAYIRQLADYRYGAEGQPLTADHSDLDAWTMADCAAMWHGYRYGVSGGVSPGGQGFSLEDFQNRLYSLSQLTKRATGIGAVESINGSFILFVHYLKQ